MFDYYQPTRIHFGDRLHELGKICKRYGERALLVTAPDGVLTPLYTEIKKILSETEIEVFHFKEVKPNPHIGIVEEGLQVLKENPVDFVLAVGGGSSMDTAKAIAFTNGVETINWDEIFEMFHSPFENYQAYTGNELPIIAVPTTSGTGSQVTQAAVLSRGNEKITFFHPLLFSKECILDPSLTLTLPAHIRSATGFDAFTHAFESYINPKASTYSKMDSLSAMKLIVENLPKAMKDPQSVEYRSNMMLADTLAGRALANGGAAAPHPLSEIIGGVLNIPHGEALAIVFPAFIKNFAVQYEEEFTEIASFFTGYNSLYEGMTAFLREINLNKRLSDYEMSEEQYDAIINSPILEHLPFGTAEDLKQILKDSY
ncbi:alcohol dehydrogenase class IV [Breznakia sp. PF5-3]|uniref:iron-containing alcohol dehydrogenase n=1 Tax=unclassified Breznakia TaxID=2623764 RepID=UPI002405D2BB|nr:MULTISPECIES: iron-containing alcohol dehydrogenase [unclassified Breznakia]MDF9825882.1 alcohol dehydrogenase class IV [Breznakia sp. PM6-1]MDF9836678.1 alcohol dehydrogenase class IV [Breznakia sp. PF5-3]